MHRFPAAVRLLFVLVCVPLPGLAQDEIGAQQSGTLLLRMQQGYTVATRLNTDVRIQVSGMVARVNVSQSFRNDGDQWVEGVYVFPLPESAAVDRLRMHAGKRVIDGEIREQAEARKAYEAARSEGRKASLVGQQRANLFTTSVANIAPGETITIEIAYLDTVAFADNAFSLRFPMTQTPRYIPGTPLADRKGNGWSADTTRVPDASLITPPVVTQSNDHRITLTADVDAGMPLDIIASRYHRVNIAENGGRYSVTFSSDESSDHDLELQWRPQASAVPRALTFTETVDGKPHVLVMLVPPAADGVVTAQAPRELIFVVDTSGSMHGTSLAQAKRAVLLGLDGLHAEDRFNIVQFNTVTEALFPQSVAASEANVRTAVHYVDELAADGGTEMRPALELALAGSAEDGRLRQVVFVTDGSVGNEEELFELIDARLGDTRLFTVGIGSAPNGWFMRKAAEAGRGSFVLISALHEVQEKMSRLVHRLESPQVTDITVQWPDNVSVLSYPQRVPDLYSGEPVLLKARLSSAPRAGDLLVVRGQSPAGGWSAELPLASGETGPGVAALWARARIESLLDDERRGADAGATRAAVVETALRHRLVSKYTSLVAVDRTPARPASAGLDTEQVPNLLPYGQSTSAIFGFPATATLAPVHRILGASCTLIAMLLLLYRVWTLRPESPQEKRRLDGNGRKA